MKSTIVCVSHEEWIHLIRYRARRRRLYRLHQMTAQMARALRNYFAPDKGVLLLRLIAVPLCVMTAILFINCPNEAFDDGEIRFALFILVCLLSSIIVLPKEYLNV